MDYNYLTNLMSVFKEAKSPKIKIYEDISPYIYILNELGYNVDIIQKNFSKIYSLIDLRIIYCDIQQKNIEEYYLDKILTINELHQYLYEKYISEIKLIEYEIIFSKSNNNFKKVDKKNFIINFKNKKSTIICYLRCKNFFVLKNLEVKNLIFKSYPKKKFFSNYYFSKLEYNKF